MTLAAGTRLGPYEIQTVIGAGGMGEVYKARDTRLQRDVAIKVLPATVFADSERRARFEREARTLASLNNPHIAQIYGVEELGGAPALVMELVEGPTFAERIARGPIAPDEALPIASQIAGALEGRTSAASLIGAILEREPAPLAALQPLTPPGVDRLVQQCLAKAPDDRPDTAHDVASQLRWVQESSRLRPVEQGPAAPAGAHSPWPPALPSLASLPALRFRGSSDHPLLLLPASSAPCWMSGPQRSCARAAAPRLAARAQL